MSVQLEVTGLRASYGSVEVLHGISLWLPHGSVVALLGANGAGKTSTLRALAGLLPATGGSITWDGDDVGGLTALQRARRGMVLVPEGRGVFPGLSVRDNLAVFGASDGDRDRGLQTFPVLGRRLGQLAGSLSGGEQQMLAMCRALLRRPSVLLLDEISLGLAPRTSQELLEAVQQLREEGRTIVLVEQYVQQALAMADLAYVLGRGQVLFAGDPEEVGGDVPGYLR